MKKRKKFLLIDPSICDSSGHYLEYAKRVLGAASKQGYKTILGANKRFCLSKLSQVDHIYNNFSFTYWENNVLGRKKMFYDWINGSALPITNHDKARQFALDLQQAICASDLEAADIIFIPTMGAAELIGLSLCATKHEIQKSSLHLLFRRDVHPDASLLQQKKKFETWELTRAFSDFKSEFPHGNYFLYTDTDRLTTKYNKLGAGRFTTLPVPADEEISLKEKWTGDKLCISLPGDIRTEKGFFILPRILWSLRRMGLSGQQIKFLIQSNSSVEKDFRTRLFFYLIKTYWHDFVQIIEGPLTSEQYRQLILKSDVILLPYDAREYQARSSGIFIEALVAGVPCIAPQGTWMQDVMQGCDHLLFQKYSEIAGIVESVLENYNNVETRYRSESMRMKEQFSSRKLVGIIACNSGGKNACIVNSH